VAWDKLLKGRTADAIITSDTPPLLDTLLYRRPARRVIRNQVPGFCGIRAKRIIQFGSVKLASPEKIAGWLRRSQRMGVLAAS
jgi:NAD(P)H dehydrogenase (quinone)